MTTIKTQKARIAVADLFPQTLVNQITILEVQENAVYDYWNKNNDAEICSNIAINLEYKDENLWALFYYGIGYRDNDTKSTVTVVRDREFQDFGDYNPAEKLTPSVYYWDMPVSVTKEQEVAQELFDILSNHCISAEKKNSPDALCEDNCMHIEEVAIALRDKQCVIFDKQLDIENIKLEQIKKIESKLEQAKKAYRDTEGRKLLAEILEADACPQMLKDLATKYKFSKVSFEKIIQSEDYMPDYGKYIIFEGMINIGTDEDVSLVRYDFGFLFEQSETYAENGDTDFTDGTPYISESDFASTIEDDEELMNPSDWTFSNTQEAYDAWHHIMKYSQEGYKRELL